MNRKEQVLQALRLFIAQRPGFEPGNYGSWQSYQSEMRSVTKDRHEAEKLISQVAWRDSIGAEQIIEAAKHAYSGRLEISVTDDGKVRLSYCTGQYFPTEYRKAVCAVLSSVLWAYFRENLPAEIQNKGDGIRNAARRELGAALARRWFR